MTPAQIRELQGFGCDQPLLDTIGEALEGTPVVVERSGGQGLFYKVLGAADAEAGLYVDPSRMHIALDPQDAARLCALTGLSVIKANPTTQRVRVHTHDLTDPTVRQHVTEAVALAVEQSAVGRSRVVSDADNPGRRDLGRCGEHGWPLNARGECVCND